MSTLDALKLATLAIAVSVAIMTVLGVLVYIGLRWCGPLGPIWICLPVMFVATFLLLRFSR